MPSDKLRSFIIVHYALFLKTLDFSIENLKTFTWEVGTLQNNDKMTLCNKRHLFYISEKGCCIIIRQVGDKKLQGEKVSQTGREVVPLLPWGTTSPCLSQYLSNVEGPTKEYANNYTIPITEAMPPDWCRLSKKFCDFEPYPHSTWLKCRCTGHLKQVRLEAVTLTSPSLHPHSTLICTENNW